MSADITRTDREWMPGAGVKIFDQPSGYQGAAAKSISASGPGRYKISSPILDPEVLEDLGEFGGSRRGDSDED